MSKTPFISFVVVARNDNYGGNFLHRIQVFLNVLLSLSEKYSFDAELIIVEWNPPQDKPRLKDALNWPKGLKYCEVRIIEVPNGIHRKLPNSDHIPLFEYIGKNVGVRRARGEYILVTNPDLVFSEELIKFLASGRLSSNYFYRLGRYDVKSPAPLDGPIEKMLKYCEQNVIRVHGYWDSFDNKFTKRFSLFRLKAFAGHLKQKVLLFPFVPPHTNASGDFLLMHRTHWFTLRGYPELKGWHQIDGLIPYMALFSELKQIILKTPLRIFHQEHSRLESSKSRSPEIELVYSQMLKEHKPIIFNDKNWGLGEYNLSESIIK